MKIIKHKCKMHACLMFLFVVVLISLPLPSRQLMLALLRAEGEVSHSQIPVNLPSPQHNIVVCTRLTWGWFEGPFILGNAQFLLEDKSDVPEF